MCYRLFCLVNFPCLQLEISFNFLKIKLLECNEKKVIGVLVQWYIGVLVHWYIGTLVHWYIGVLVHWYIGVLVHWYIGILVY